MDYVPGVTRQELSTLWTADPFQVEAGHMVGNTHTRSCAALDYGTVVLLVLRLGILRHDADHMAQVIPISPPSLKDHLCYR